MSPSEIINFVVDHLNPKKKPAIDLPPGTIDELYKEIMKTCDNDKPTFPENITLNINVNQIGINDVTKNDGAVKMSNIVKAINSIAKAVANLAKLHYHQQRQHDLVSGNTVEKQKAANEKQDDNTKYITNADQHETNQAVDEGNVIETRANDDIVRFDKTEISDKEATWSGREEDPQDAFENAFQGFISLWSNELLNFSDRK